MMSNNEKERYSRQLSLKGFGEEAQQKLMAAKVLVIGAGGLGCPALQYLAAAGVGTIGIADNDVVSLSNLHRQILYSTADIGLFKVDAAAEKLKRLNPAITIITYRLTVQNTNAFTIISQYDWVLDATDNFVTRYMINDACVLLGKSLVYGAVSQYQGQVTIFNMPCKNGRTSNYRDLFPIPPEYNEVPDCATAGVLGVLPGIIGTMQAAEIIKLITGLGQPLINKLLTYNFLTNEIFDFDIVPSALNKSQGPVDEMAFLQMNYKSFCHLAEKKIIEIDGDEFELLRKQPETVVIDVREVHELPLVTNFDHRQIPMSVFKQAMAGINENNVILFCQHGIRSMYAGELMQQFFSSSKNLYSLKGGISRWAGQLL